MAHVIRIASLLVLLILLACSGDDPTEDPSPTDGLGTGQDSCNGGTANCNPENSSDAKGDPGSHLYA